MMNRELTDSEWAEGIPLRRTMTRIRSHEKRTSITINRRRSDRLPLSIVRADPLAKTTTIRSHRPRCTGAHHCRKSGRIHVPQLMICISVKVSSILWKLISLSTLIPFLLKSASLWYWINIIHQIWRSEWNVRDPSFYYDFFYEILANSTILYFPANFVKIPFIDDSIEYLQTISDRVYLEEAGYWGLLALREREKEYVDVGNINNEKYFG